MVWLGTIPARIAQRAGTSRTSADVASSCSACTAEPRHCDGRVTAAGLSAVAFLERVRVAGLADGEHGVGDLNAGRLAAGIECERPVGLQAVRPDFVGAFPERSRRTGQRRSVVKMCARHDSGMGGMAIVTMPTSDALPPSTRTSRAISRVGSDLPRRDGALRLGWCDTGGRRPGASPRTAGTPCGATMRDPLDENPEIVPRRSRRGWSVLHYGRHMGEDTRAGADVIKGTRIFLGRGTSGALSEPRPAQREPGLTPDCDAALRPARHRSGSRRRSASSAGRSSRPATSLEPRRHEYVVAHA